MGPDVFSAPGRGSAEPRPNALRRSRRLWAGHL